MASSIFSFAGASGSGGDFPDIIKVSVETRRITREDYDGEKTSTEITDGFKCVMDLENLELGWVMFSSAGPAFAVAKIGDPVPPRPTEDYKPGFRVMLKLAKESGGDVRELSSNSRIMRDSLGDLYSEFLAKREGDKLPVVTLARWQEEKIDGKGKFPSKTFFRPVWQIAGWAPRPSDLQYVPRGAPAPVSATAAAINGAGAPPATGSTRVDPPKAAPQPAMAGGEDDFG